MAKLLLVDDSKLTLKKMTKLISLVGEHDVEVASNGAEAMKRLQEDSSPFDLIITDLHMPEMDGYQLVSNIQQEKIPTPIVVCTADQQEATVTKLKSLGAQDVFSKPYLYNQNNIQTLIKKFAQVS